MTPDEPTRAELVIEGIAAFLRTACFVLVGLGIGALIVEVFS